MYGNFKALSATILQCAKIAVEPKRSTFILRRLHPTRLNRLGDEKKKKLKRKQFFYELVEHRDSKPQAYIDLLLTKSVEGVGVEGQLVKMKEVRAYEQFILPGRAIYATPEIMEQYSSQDVTSRALFAIKDLTSKLRNEIVPVLLSSKIDWVLQPWHINVALRQVGIMTNAESITLPHNEIRGPSEDLQERDFYVDLAIDEENSCPVRCRIFQVAVLEKFSLPEYTKEENCDPERFIFPEDASLFESMSKQREGKDPS